ncbi:hypothetical protein NMY22_g20016 [Coprinellus aureogranulatus]|nr:hypothetical protein NMY22_g20016 [Coprinellus aureogranulatus]
MRLIKHDVPLAPASFQNVKEDLPRLVKAKDKIHACVRTQDWSQGGAFSSAYRPRLEPPLPTQLTEVHCDTIRIVMINAQTTSDKCSAPSLIGVSCWLSDAPSSALRHLYMSNDDAKNDAGSFIYALPRTSSKRSSHLSLPIS